MIALAPGQHVVIGAGNVGRRIAEQLVEAGAPVTVVTRSQPQAPVRGVTHVVGDVLRLREIWAQIPRASVIYNCANPTYQTWVRQWPHITRAVNAFAESTGAVLATASNLYAYGSVSGPIREDTPLRATFRNGRARMLSWDASLNMHRKGLIRATEVRAADFICTGNQSRMGDRVVPRVLAGKPVQLLGNVSTDHSWAFPSDVATALLVVANDPRGWGRAWHAPVNAPRSQTDVVNDIADVATVARVKVSTIPLSIRRMVELTNPVVRELRDTEYQWDKPFIVNSSAITNMFGVEPTDWRTGLRQLVESYRDSIPAGR